MANLKDVAKQANVSPMTVSRVVNGTGYVNEETRKKVLEAIRDLRYVPNGTARSLVSRRTNTLALILPDIRNPFYTTMARGVEDVASRNGFRVLLCNHDDDDEKERDYVNMCALIRCDGVVIAASGDEARESLRLLETQQIPYGLLGREVRGVQADIVKGNNEAGARMLVDHLVGLGHKNLAMVVYRRKNSAVRERVAGFLHALEECGLACRDEWMIEISANKIPDPEVMRRVMSVDDRPTALVVAGNDIAFRTIQTLRDLGLSIPDDVSLACFDDIDHEYAVESFVTSVVQPAYNFGSLGTQLLIERIGIGCVTSPRKVILQPEVFVRRSTALRAF